MTEEMILHHWALERRLTSELLASDPEHRWEVFERCYTMLYSELGWLNELIDTASPPCEIDGADDWCRLIGPPPKRVYEVGSGKGRLIAALANRGYDCTATEITRERGSRWTAARQSLRWTNSDGVHFERFEASGSFDAVISDQVIEHLHPDDLVDHFRGVYTILKPGGRYVFGTPHAFEGPFDVSRVFGTDRAEGMHLKDTPTGSCTPHFAGPGSVGSAAFRLPRAVRARFGGRPFPIPSRAYRLYLCSVERMIAPLRCHWRRRAARALRVGLWTSGITLVAIKNTGDGRQLNRARNS